MRETDKEIEREIEYVCTCEFGERSIIVIYFNVRERKDYFGGIVRERERK